MDHYQHKRENKMKNRCKEFGEFSLANRLAGCVNIDINCAAVRVRHAEAIRAKASFAETDAEEAFRSKSMNIAENNA